MARHYSPARMMDRRTESHIIYNRAQQTNIGLFGYVSGATITNIKLDSVKITGNNNVGGLIGIQQNNSTIAKLLQRRFCNGDGNNVGGLMGFNKIILPSQTASAPFCNG